MYISKLIEHLEEIKSQKGDIPIFNREVFFHGGEPAVYRLGKSEIVYYEGGPWFQEGIYL